jgi:hypothetical protein
MDIVRGFEDCTLPAERFRHRDHLFVAWTYLREAPFAEAAARFAANVKRFAAAHGAHAKYHETITWAYFTLVNERMQGCSDQDFDGFLSKNLDLLDHRSGALSAYYAPEVLASELARAVFVLPRPRA